MPGDVPRDAVLPTGRFWVRVLLLYPAITATLGGAAAVSLGGDWARPVVAVLGVVVAMMILRDRQVHAMPPGWQVWWLVLGLCAWAAAAAALAFAAFAVILLVACSRSACFS